MRNSIIGLTAIIGCGIALALAGCAEGGGSQAASVATVQPTPEGTATPAATNTPTPLSAQALGTPVLTTDGLTVTALKYRHVSSNNQFETPPPGGYFAAADVRECAGTTAITVSGSDWSLIDADQSQISGQYSASLVNLPGPELQLMTHLNPGQCVSGWVEFIVPGATTPIEVQPKGADYYWILG